MNFVSPIKSKEDISKMEDYLAKKSLRNRLIFMVGVNTGLRVSDILRLKISDVYEKEYIEIREKKTNKYKRIALNDKLQRLIKEFLKDKQKSNKLLFVSKSGKQLYRSQVYNFLNEASKAVGIRENIGTHSMRKSFGYHHFKQNNDIVLLQKLMNHSSLFVTLAYIGFDQEKIDKSYKNFEL